VEGAQEATDPGQPCKPFQETTRTMIVFPRGGVVRLAAKVVRGKLVTVTNLNTRHRMLCRVVNVRDYPNMKAYVEFELTQPASAFLGVSFHPEAAAPPAVSAPWNMSPDPLTTATPERAQPGDSRGATLPQQTLKSASAPISRGSLPTILAPKTIQPVAAEPAAQSFLHNTADALEDPAARSVPRPIFSGDSHLFAASTAEPCIPEASARANKSHLARRVRFVAAALLAVAASTWFLLPDDPTTSAPSSAQGASPGGIAFAGDVQSSGVASTVVTVTAKLPSFSPENRVEPPPTLFPNGNNESLNPANARKDQASKQSKGGALPAITLAAPSVTPGQTANQNVELPPDPTGDAGGLALPGETRTGGIFGDASKSERLPPPPPVENRAPILPGGVATPAHLVSSIQPVYPLEARRFHIQGDVHILASIDERGNVTEMNVLSGAMQLQGAAMEAVRQWKFVAAKLNGKAVASQTTVIVRFQLAR